MNNNLIYLGVLSAPTTAGRRAAAVALVGAAECYHLVNADFPVNSELANDWLWTAGINPDEAHSALTAEQIVEAVLVPAIGTGTLVINHADMDIDLVALLSSKLGRMGNPAIVSGIDLKGPFQEVCNGAAGKRAFAMQGHYEAALANSKERPARHVLTGSVNEHGQLTELQIKGPFATRNWQLEADDDGVFALMSIAGMRERMAVEVPSSPASARITLLLSALGWS